MSDGVKENETILRTERLTKIYSTGKFKVKALADVNIQVARGKFMGIAGPSGSGKSTLMNLLGGLDTPTSGIIEAHGKRISELNKQDLALYRRAVVGMIFQSFNLISSFTALENVGLPLLFAGVAKNERKNRGMEVLSQVGLSARFHHRPAELSGGEQQRVAIARAFVNRPEILLADEPTGNLDSQTSRDIVGILAGLVSSQEMTVIMVSHELTLLQEHSDKIITLIDGKVQKSESYR